MINKKYFNFNFCNFILIKKKINFLYSKFNFFLQFLNFLIINYNFFYFSYFLLKNNIKINVLNFDISNCLYLNLKIFNFFNL